MDLTKNRYSSQHRSDNAVDKKDVDRIVGRYMDTINAAFRIVDNELSRLDKTGELSQEVYRQIRNINRSHTDS